MAPVKSANVIWDILKFVEQLLGLDVAERF